MPSGTYLITTPEKTLKLYSKNIFKEASILGLKNFTLRILDYDETIAIKRITMNRVSGIYCIRNIKNNKRYIGMSTNIFCRWNIHVNYCFKQFEDTKLYKEMNKNTIYDFEFSILEYVTKDKLPDREKYWIKYFDATKDYNVTIGGYSVGLLWYEDKHPNHKLTKEQVIDIRIRYANHENYWDVKCDYCDFIGESGFKKIWNGYTWKNIMPEIYTLENKNFHKNNVHFNGYNNPRAHLPETLINEIKNKLNEGIKIDIIYNDYKDLFERVHFYNVCKKIKDGIW